MDDSAKDAGNEIGRKNGPSTWWRPEREELSKTLKKGFPRRRGKSI